MCLADYWEVGATSTSIETGWLGRYLDDVGTPTNPLQGLSMDGEMNPTLATAHNPVAAIDRPETFSLWMQGVGGDVFSMALDSASRLGDAGRRSADPAIAQVAEAASEVGVVRRACLKQQDARRGILREAQRQDASRTTGTNDDIVVHSHLYDPERL